MSEALRSGGTEGSYAMVCQAGRQIRLLMDGLQTGTPARAEGHEPER